MGFCALIYTGFGEDCHRTWESILLGAIPIVRESLIRPLFEDAPVMVLEDLMSPKIGPRTLLEHQIKTTR